jgi:RNA polymerase sigma-B factor
MRSSWRTCGWPIRSPDVSASEARTTKISFRWLAWVWWKPHGALTPNALHPAQFPDHGNFLSFAAATIRGTLKHHFRDHGWGVRPSRQSQELAAEIRREWSSLAQTLGAIPSERDLAARLGSTLTEVREAQQASLSYICRPFDDAAEPQAGMGTGGEEVDRLEARLVVAQIWGELTDVEQELLRLRFYEQRSQTEIAVILGTSQMQVSRLLTRLLAKLRVFIDADAGLTLAS